MLETTRSSEVSVPKAFGADNDEVVGGSDNGRADETDGIQAKSKNIKKSSKTKKFAKAKRSES